MKQKGGRPSQIPKDLLQIEKKQGRCPKGHLLPHKTNRGRCTPVYCPGSLSGTSDVLAHENIKESVANTSISSALRIQKKEALKMVSQEADALIDSMIPGDTATGRAARVAAKAQKGDELIKLGHSIGRWAAMRSYFKVPDGLAGSAAEEFVKRKSELLSVDAIVDLERDLKLGDDLQRREARRDLMDMLGIRRREAAPQARSVIVLVGQQGGRVVPPWEVEGKVLQAGETPDIPHRPNEKEIPVPKKDRT